MLNIWVIVLLVLLIVGVKIAPRRTIFADYLSSTYTSGLRGILALGVILCHLTQQTSGGTIFRLAFSYIGPLCVAGFFFLSGYGCMAQYLKKGKDYLKGFLAKRLLSVWIPLLIVAIILGITKVILHDEFPAQGIIRSLLQGEFFVRYSGFVVVLSFFYVLFFCAAKIDSNTKPGGGIIWIILILGWGLWIIQCFTRNVSDGLYRTCSVFIFGVLWAAYKDTIDSFVDSRWLGTIVISFLLFITLFVGRGIIPQEGKEQLITTSVQASKFTSVLRFILADLSAMSFCAFLFLCGKKIKFQNKAIVTLGSISYEIYLLQGLWMLVGRNTIWNISNDFIYSVIVVVGSILSAGLVHILSRYLLKIVGLSKVQKGGS